MYLIRKIIQLLLIYGEDDEDDEDGEDGEDGDDYSLSPRKNEKSGKDYAAFRSAKKVFLQYISLKKRNVQAGTSLLSSTNDDDDYYGYSDEENYVDSGEESYVDVTFKPLQPREKEIKKDFEIPKKCRRPDVCYIMKLCIYCKPFFKRKLKNG